MVRLVIDVGTRDEEYTERRSKSGRIKRGVKGGRGERGWNCTVWYGIVWYSIVHGMASHHVT